MTHKELVDQAVRQLKKWHCIPVCRELMCYTSSNEIPDAIGWTHCTSIMFECKASRADFLRDKEKPFRILLPELGVGDFRFYLTNEGVILEEKEIPPGWGCYVIRNGKPVHKFGVRYDNAVPHPLIGNKRDELAMMRSWIRRFVESNNYHWKAVPGIRKKGDGYGVETIKNYTTCNKVEVTPTGSPFCEKSEIMGQFPCDTCDIYEPKNGAVK